MSQDSAQEIAARLDVESLRLQRLIEAAYSPIITIDESGRIVLYNAAAERAFGYTLSEALNQPLDILIPIHHVGAHKAEVARHFKEGAPNRPMAAKRDVYGKRKNGETFPIEVAITRVDTPEGRYSTAIVRDLTERKTFEQKLVQSAKLEALGQLTGGVAHDFNNLLSIVLTNLDLLVEDVGLRSPGEKVLERAERIRRTCERGVELVRLMTGFARKMQAPLVSFNVCAALNELVEVLRHGIGRRYAINLEVDDEDLQICVDPAQFETSMLNLSFNARDAMPWGGKLDFIVRRTEHRKGFDGWIELVVRDSGTGIPPEIGEKIFEPFYTTKEAGKGTGLGLVMVKRFIDESGGDISVESEMGVGTSFTLRFPEAVGL